MEYKSANRKYLAYILVIAALIVFMLSVSAAAVKSDSKSFTSNYDQVIEFGEWYVKVNNAVYIPEQQIIEFTYSIKPRFSETVTSEPSIVMVTTNRSYNKGKEYYITETEQERAEYTVLNIEDDFKYLTIMFTSKAPDTQVPDSVDEFGDVIKGGVQEGKVSSGRVVVDRKDMLNLSSQERSTFTTDQTAAFTSATETSTSAAADVSLVSTTTTAASSTTTAADTSKNAETTTQKTTTAKKTTTTKKAAVTTKKTTTAAQPAQTQAPAPAPTTTAAAATTPARAVTTTAAPTTISPQTTTTQRTTTAKATTTAKKTTTTKRTTTTTIAVVKVNGIHLETNYAANNIVLTSGQTSYARAVISPVNATDKTVTWASNRPDIAVVDSNGRITAVAKGKAIITATTVDGGLSASCMVTVS